jgi:hypothetical protein
LKPSALSGSADNPFDGDQSRTKVRGASTFNRQKTSEFRHFSLIFEAFFVHSADAQEGKRKRPPETPAAAFLIKSRQGVSAW